MTARPHRSLVLVSARRFCVVCDNNGRIGLVRVRDMRGTGVIACPHCSNGAHPIPILTLPMRNETPRGAA